MITKVNWETIKEYTDILFQFYNGIGKISINRPHKHNAFTPLTVQEMSEAMELARQDTRTAGPITSRRGGASSTGTK